MDKNYEETKDLSLKELTVIIRKEIRRVSKILKFKVNITNLYDQLNIKWEPIGWTSYNKGNALDLTFFSRRLRDRMSSYIKSFGQYRCNEANTYCHEIFNKEKNAYLQQVPFEGAEVVLEDPNLFKDLSKEETLKEMIE